MYVGSAARLAEMPGMPHEVVSSFARAAYLLADAGGRVGSAVNSGAAAAEVAASAAAAFAAAVARSVAPSVRSLVQPAKETCLGYPCSVRLLCAAAEDSAGAAAAVAS